MWGISNDYPGVSRCDMGVTRQPGTVVTLPLWGLGFPGGSDGKESICNVGDLSLIPGLGRSPRGGHSNPLQYSCLENPMDMGLQRIAHG